MNRFPRFAVIAALLSAAIVAPLASAIGNGSFQKPARFDSEVAVVAQDKPMLIELDTMLVSAPAPVKARVAAPKASNRATAYHSLSETELEQGGRPGASSVIRWN